MLEFPWYPTWIPQWDVEPIRSIGGSHRAGMKFDASGGWNPKPPAELIWKRNERHLILQGFILGRVTSSHSVLPPLSYKDSEGRRRKKLKAHNAELDGWLNRNVSSHNDMNTQLPLVLTAGQDWYGNILRDQVAILRHTESFEKWKRKYLKNKVPHDIDAVKYGQAMTNVCDDRQLFTATGRLLGLGPRLLRNNDVICVVAGGQVPYALRPLMDGRFYFVGECYVAGCMFGKAIQDWRSQTQASSTVQRFILV